MRRAGAPLVASFLLAEALLLRLAPDASPAFTIPFHALGVVLGGLLAVRSRAAVRAAFLVLLFSSAVLGWIETAAVWRRGTGRLEDVATRRAGMERDAETALAALDALLDREQELVRSLPEDLLGAGPGRAQLFARLEEIERARGRGVGETGITIFDRSGRALAWAGESSVEAGWLDAAPPAGEPEQLIHKAPLETTLVTSEAGSAGVGRIVAVEIVLASPSKPAAWRSLVSLPRLDSDVTLELLDPDEADTALQDFLAPEGGRYWKQGRGDVGQLLAAWRSPHGRILGLLTVSPESSSAVEAHGPRGGSASRQILLVLAGAAALLLVLRSARATHLAAPELAAAAVLVVTLRLALGTPSSFLLDRPLFDYRLFSAPLPLGLAASPGDVLLTCLTALALAGLGAVAVRRGPPWAAATGGGAALALLAGLVLATAPWVTNSSLNPSHVPILPPELPHLALGWAHASLAMAAALLGVAAFLPRTRGMSLRASAGALIAAGAFSHGLLVHRASKVPMNLIERSLAPEVLRARTAAVDRVTEFLAVAVSDPRWQDVAAMNDSARERATFAGWRASDLGRTGARSAIAVLDVRGRILSSFAYGLPASVFEDTSAAVEPPSGVEPETPAGGRGGPDRADPSLAGISSPPQGSQSSPVLAPTFLRVLSLAVPLLRGDATVVHDGRAVCRIAVLLSTEWDNLPFLTLGDPLLRSLGTGGAERYDEYFGGTPLFVAYSPSGEVLVPSAEQVAPLSASLLRTKTPLWTTTLFAGTEYRTYLFPTPDGPRAIGYVAPSSVATAAGLLRSIGLQIPFVALLLLVMSILRTRDLPALLAPERWIRPFGASYSQRVQAVVLTCALVPLVALAVFSRNTIERRTREAVERAGVQSAATIRRLLEDYVESGAGGGSAVRIGSRTLFWMARTVHQDIHLFVDDELLATSRGDPESSGLRGFRLDGSVARALTLGRPPQILSRQPLPGGRTALVYAPVHLDSGAPEGVFALPLLVQERDLTRGSESIADALLVATVALSLLLSIIGYLFARRLSVPIHDLALASRSIAGGELEVRVRPRGKDEVRQLIDAFNRMAASLSEQREDLRRRKDYIEAILLNVTTGVISTDARGVVRTSNPAASFVLGLPVDLVGRHLFEELRGRADLAPVLAAWTGTKAGTGPTAAREVSIRRDGREVRLRSVVLPLAETDDGVPGSIFLVEDVTEVMRSNRLAAWAEMARRIAHEIKNPLTPIQLSAEHLLRVRSDERADYDRVLRQCVDTILGQVRELREIASEFSTYARLPDLQRVPTDLGTVLHATIAPYAEMAPAGVEVRTRFDPIPPVLVDPRVLNRAFVNLIENALQAMDGGGVLSVALHRAEGPEGDRAEIVFEDTGEGMDEATRARIFEPYFSTRDTGTGLGLAIAKRAVEEHGGTITVESTPGRGTRMIVRLPLEAEGPGSPGQSAGEASVRARPAPSS